MLSNADRRVSRSPHGYRREPKKHSESAGAGKHRSGHPLQGLIIRPAMEAAVLAQRVTARERKKPKRSSCTLSLINRRRCSSSREGLGDA